MAEVNTKLFIHKNWIKNRGTATVTQTVTCEPVATWQPNGVNFSVRCSPVTLRTLDHLIRPNCKIKHQQINTYHELFG